MAAIPVPSVNTPTYQTWAAAVANQLNAVSTYWRSALTANSGDYTNAVANSTMNIGVTVTAGQKIRIIAHAQIQHHTGGQTHDRIYIMEGATQLGTAIQANLPANSYTTVQCERILSPSAGTHTYNLAVSTDVGSSRIIGDGTEPSWLTAEVMS